MAKTAWAVAEVLRISADPVIASHSCVRALCDHDRNLTDDQIRAIAAAGGLIGVITKVEDVSVKVRVAERVEVDVLKTGVARTLKD